MHTKNPHFLALTETFVTTLVSISGLVACSLLSVCLVPHRPRSHLGNLKESCWSRYSEKSWFSWLVRTSAVYFMEQYQTYVYNHMPSQTLKPLDYNTSYSLESHPGPGKRSFPSRKTNIHLHQEAWRQGWKMDGCKVVNSLFLRKMHQPLHVERIMKRKPWKKHLFFQLSSDWNLPLGHGMQIRVVPCSTEWCPTGHTLQPTCGCSAKKSQPSIGKARAHPKCRACWIVCSFSFAYIIYIMQNISVCWSISIFKHYVSTHVQIRCKSDYDFLDNYSSWQTWRLWSKPMWVQMPNLQSIGNNYQ